MMKGFVSPGGMAPSGTSPSHVLLLGVPADDPAPRVERLALAIDRGAVVEDAAVHRPRPGPLRMEPDAVRRVGRVASGGQVALLRVAAAVDPVARHGAAVVLQLREAGHLLAGGEALCRRLVRHVGQEPPVQLARDAVRIGLVAVVPGEVPDRLREHPVLLVRALHGLGEPVDDVEIGTAVGDGLHRAVAPLRPAPAVDDAALLLDAGGGGEHEHLGRDLGRIDARPLPEARRLVLEQIGDHHPFELVQPGPDQARVGAAHRGVLAEAEEPLHLAGQHGVGEREERVALALESARRASGRYEKAKSFSRRGVLAPPGLQQAHDVLRRVLQPVRALAGFAATGVTRLR